jgi:hypothetical protein
MILRLGFWAIAAATIAAAPMSVAQEAAQETVWPVGQVTELSGPEGSVLVLRDGRSFVLVHGDAHFAGDEVFTRVDGEVDLDLIESRDEEPGSSFSVCHFTLIGASSLRIPSVNYCSSNLVALAPTDRIGGVAIESGGSVGSSPMVLGLLGAGGAAAAAGAGGGGGGGGTGRPVSP